MARIKRPEKCPLVFDDNTCIGSGKPCEKTSDPVCKAVVVAYSIGMDDGRDECLFKVMDEVRGLMTMVDIKPKRRSERLQ